MTVQSRLYMAFGVALTAFGFAWVLIADPSSVTYAPVEGISVFAVLYVIAQGAERVTEWVVDLLSLVPDSPEERKRDGLRAVRAADSTLNGNPSLADFGPQVAVGNQADVSAAIQAVSDRAAEAAESKAEGETKADSARRDIAFLGHGVSFAACAVAVNALNYGLLGHVGAKGVDGDLDRLVTALAATGGTKALHELIGRLQKAKESKEAGE